MLSRKQLLRTLQVTEMIFIATLCFLIIFCYLKAYLTEVDYYLLLENMKKRSLNERVREMGFVCDELENICNQEKVEVDINGNIRIESRRGEV